MHGLLNNTAFLIMASLCIVWIVQAVAYTWWKIRRDEIEADLKHEMLHRGMSADDIVKVLAARSSPKKEKSNCGEARSKEFAAHG